MRENYIEIIATEENNSQIQDWTNEDICEAFMSGDLWDYTNSCPTFSGIDNYEEAGRILEGEGFAFFKVLDAEGQEVNTFKVIVPTQYKKGEKEIFIVGLIHKIFDEPEYIYDWISDIVSGDELDDWVKISKESLPDKLYHGTSEEAIESILKEGLIVDNIIRGLNNRGVGAAIFTSSDAEDIESYATGALFEIDVNAMQNDGIEIEWSQEPDIEMYQKINDLLFKLNIQNKYFVENFFDPEPDQSPNTFILYKNILPKYLKLIWKKEASYVEEKIIKKALFKKESSLVGLMTFGIPRKLGKQLNELWGDNWDFVFVKWIMDDPMQVSTKDKIEQLSVLGAFCDAQDKTSFAEKNKEKIMKVLRTKYSLDGQAEQIFGRFINGYTSAYNDFISGEDILNDVYDSFFNEFMSDISSYTTEGTFENDILTKNIIHHNQAKRMPREKAVEIWESKHLATKKVVKEYDDGFKWIIASKGTGTNTFICNLFHNCGRTSHATLGSLNPEDVYVYVLLDEKNEGAVLLTYCPTYTKYEWQTPYKRISDIEGYRYRPPEEKYNKYILDIINMLEPDVIVKENKEFDIYDHKTQKQIKLNYEKLNEQMKDLYGDKLKTREELF